MFTPNRRAARELALALYRAAGRTLLAPDIRALGDVDSDDEDPFAAGEDAELPPAIPPERRRGALAKLIQAWRSAQGEAPFPPASALAAADELARLIDQAAIAGGVDWSALAGLSLTADLAEHWRLSAGFLEIVGAHWPAHLAERGEVDAMERRSHAADRLAERWRAKPPTAPVVIAGSTGSSQAVRRLMRAVLALPKGIVVLPGLDPEIDGAGWRLVATSPSHPQHALFDTLTALGLKPQQAQLWPGAAETPRQRARRRLVNEALAPAEATRGWNERLAALARPDSAPDLVREGLAGVRLIETEDESEEALVAALLLRETLEHKDLTAALVTPEAGLARRAAGLLARWGIEASPSSGAPLHHAPAGSLLLLTARWASDPGDPVALLALLKHGLARVGYGEAELRQRVTQMELRALRGPRRHRDLEDLAARLGEAADDGAAADVQELVRRLAWLHAEWAPPILRPDASGHAAVEALSQLAMRIAAAPEDSEGLRLFAGRSGEAAARFLEQLAALVEEMGGWRGPQMADLAETLMTQMATPPEAPEHPRIAIWGPLEARLQRRDRIILASLNEGAWPQLPGADSFVNRSLRRQAGLPDPDERVGLAAHDFAQLASARDLILLRAKRVDDKPAVASRWIWRLRTLAAGGVGDRRASEAMLTPEAASDPLLWARALRDIPALPAAQAPSPRPPVAMRQLGRLSPSRVSALIRDPYADFAKSVLDLKVLRRPGTPLDAGGRGTAVHAALEAFTKRPAGSQADLERLILDHLEAAGAAAEAIELERPMWLAAARRFLDWEAERSKRIAKTVTEVWGRIAVPVSFGSVELGARADRIDVLSDGTLAIIDYKTGAIKSATQVRSGLEPQLALEAAIAARAAFGAAGPAPTSELIYYRMAASLADDDASGRPLAFKDATPMEVAEEALAGFVKLVERFADPGQPYLSKPRVEFVWSQSDYDRLARREEWASEEGDT